MTRARLLGAMGACALVALGLTATPIATTTAAAAPEVSPGLVAAMSRDLGLTEAQAAARVRQESAAIRTEPTAKAAAGEDFGGSWFDPASGSLVVGLVDRDHAGAVLATGARVADVERTQAELDADKARLDRAAAPREVLSWHADPRSGGVVVTVLAGSADKGAVRAFLGLVKDVTVVEAAERPVPFAAGTVGGDPFYINGNTRCSIGFSVHGGFVTAGHCGGVGASVAGWDGSAMGSFAGSSFPGNDYAFVRIGNGWWTAPVVLGWGTVPDQLVRGSGEAPVGSSICRSGSTTRWHCGRVLAKNETVNYAQGAVHQMTKTSVCAQPGDSGGSFITGDQAQGVTSGGWGNCSSGGETWYQPVNEILAVYGLGLVTA
ncbi:S1 family peptidase [Actinophytocola xanthii]|uniref:Serine protease n=1 Tax=Actinophytocola xanthii TaxID=1912961 RepID=A0A1Q8CM44_9PSEU|nr:S1 family peptidase [Actinophytocola xanthii]OLF15424.1 serine protease [Actinophytocola xanthii]